MAKLERAIDKNQQARIKYADEPARSVLWLSLFLAPPFS